MYNIITDLNIYILTHAWHLSQHDIPQYSVLLDVFEVRLPPKISEHEANYVCLDLMWNLILNKKKLTSRYFN